MFAIWKEGLFQVGRPWARVYLWQHCGKVWNWRPIKMGSNSNHDLSSTLLLWPDLKPWLGCYLWTNNKNHVLPLPLTGGFSSFKKMMGHFPPLRLPLADPFLKNVEEDVKLNKSLIILHPCVFKFIFNGRLFNVPNYSHEPFLIHSQQCIVSVTSHVPWKLMQTRVCAPHMKC